MSTRPLTQPLSFVHTLAGGRLRCVEGPAAPRSWPVGADELRLGCSPDADIVLPSGSAAADHALLRWTPEGVLLRGLGEQLVRVGEELVREAWLSPHHGFGVGECTFFFESADVVSALDAVRAERVAGLCGRSDAMRELLDALGRLAPTPLPVLVTGETGVGKNRVARALHALSGRGGPFVVYDCAAVGPHLAASELFGHVAGAFSGAASDRVGALGRADGGTLLIDHVEDLPLALQPLFLRALEERSYQPVGSGERRVADVRLVLTTRAELREEVAAGRFREDLYYRISVAELVVPALRARLRDVPLLVDDLLDELGSGHTATLELRAALGAWSWPGNVRELRNVLARAAALSEGRELGLDALPAALAEGFEAPEVPLSRMPWRRARAWLVEAFERRRLVELLAACDGNAAEVARVAGLAHETVLRRLKRYGLR